MDLIDDVRLVSCPICGKQVLLDPQFVSMIDAWYCSERCYEVDQLEKIAKEGYNNYIYKTKDYLYDRNY